MMADQYRIYFIAQARFLARCALIGARRCSSAKRRAAFTSLADSDHPGHREARARAGRVRQHDKLLRLSLRPVMRPNLKNNLNIPLVISLGRGKYRPP